MKKFFFSLFTLIDQDQEEDMIETEVEVDHIKEAIQEVDQCHLKEEIMVKLKMVKEMN
jgi:hypothetical protein